MANELAVKKASALEALASRLEVSKETLQATLKATAFSCCKTNEEFVAAVIVANTYKLNPILGEIYAFPSKGGAVKPIVPIDGWISLVNRNEDHNGVTLVENREKDGKKNESKTDVVSVTATFFHKTKEHPTVVTEYMSECFDGAKQPWVRWPIRMLRHKAYIQGARVAYGLSGIYDPDEAERIVEGEIASGITPIVMPSPKIPDPVVQVPVVEVSPSGVLTQEEKDEIEAQEAKAAQEALNARKAKAKVANEADKNR